MNILDFLFSHSIFNVLRHFHDYYEFYFLISDNIQYTIDDHGYSPRKGDVYNYIAKIFWHYNPCETATLKTPLYS